MSGPSGRLDGVVFHPELPVHVNKQTDLPAYLKQLALERIGDTPIDTVQPLMRPLVLLHFFQMEEILILFDSRSAIPHLYNWQSVRDNVVVSILTKIRRLSTLHQIHLQWIPSHVDLEGNEIADTFSKAGACEIPEPSEPSSTFLEIYSRTKHQNKTAWIVPPEHHWYQCSRSGSSLAHGFKRQDQTLLSRFRSDHLKTMKFSEGCKSFEMCTNCSSEPATPAHILECLGLTKQDLADD
ncbi:RNase H domain-containing protein [Trichonephila clavipes]|nr:RNase H domain-containing protein [Trichonephila clavipes]